MKNRVLRLAIVAVLVIAMVLTMAACGDKPVESPSTTPTTAPTATATPTVAPTTTASPSTSPVVSDDEAELEAKFGITFPETTGKVAFATDGSENGSLKVINAYGDVTFGMLAPTANSTYKAYLTLGSADRTTSAFTVTAKVTSAVDFAGGKIASDTYTVSDAGVVTPTAAGIYTVTYTVKVNVAAQTIGFVSVAKEAKTYTVTKTYEVAKMAVEIAGETQGMSISSTGAAVAATIDFGGLTGYNLAALKNELGLGTDAKYTLTMDFITAGTSVAGTYEMPLIAKDSKGNVVDVTSLTAKNFDVTFVNGTRYVYSKLEEAQAAAALEDLQLADGDYDAAAVAVAKATYEGLSEVVKFKIDSVAVTGTTVPTDTQWNSSRFKANVYNDGRQNLQSELKALADAYLAKVDNDAEYTAIAAYLMGLSQTAPATGLDSNYTFATEILTGKYAAILEKFNTTNTAVVAAMQAKVDAVETEYNAITDDMTSAEWSTYTTAYSAYVTAYDSLNDFYKAQKYATTGKAYTGKKFSAISAVLAANNTSVNAIVADLKTVVADLDAYKSGVNFNTLGAVSTMLGYNFAEYWTWDNAATTFYGLIRKAENRYFAEDLVASYKTMISNYVALEAAIKTAQNELAMNLGDKIIDAQATVDSYAVVSVIGGNIFMAEVTEGPEVSALDYMQTAIAKAALAQVAATADALPFAGLAKKTLDEVNAAALKDVVAYFTENTAELAAFVSGTAPTVPGIVTAGTEYTSAANYAAATATKYLKVAAGVYSAE